MRSPLKIDVVDISSRWEESRGLQNLLHKLGVISLCINGGQQRITAWKIYSKTPTIEVCLDNPNRAIVKPFV